MKKFIGTIGIALILFACQKDEPEQVLGKMNSTELGITADSSYRIILQKNIVYAKGYHHSTINSNNKWLNDLLLDAYIPDNSSKDRPILVMIHGGGFKNGGKEDQNMQRFARYFASRGWVAFCINYRLMRNKGTVPIEWLSYGQNNINPNLLGEYLAMYPAHRDAKAAIQWIVANAEQFDIDPEKLTVCGGSVGAIIAISLGVSNPEDYNLEIPLSQDSSLATTNQNQNFKVNSVINFWGSDSGLVALSKIYGHNRYDASDAKVLTFHGTLDPIVPYSNAIKLQNNYLATGVNFELYPLTGLGHGQWFATINNRSFEEHIFNFIVKEQNLMVN